MKPGNRHVFLTWCQFTQSLTALGDERRDDYFICLSAHVGKAFCVPTYTSIYVLCIGKIEI